MLVVLTGLPGTGKTTVAEELAQELDARVWSTDKIRKGAVKEPGYSKRKTRSMPCSLPSFTWAWFP